MLMKVLLHSNFQSMILFTERKPVLETSHRSGGWRGKGGGRQGRGQEESSAFAADFTPAL